MNIMKKVMISLIFLGVIISISSVCFADTGTVKVYSLILREGPSTSTDVITTLKQNQEVEIIKQEGKWYQVKYKELTGYVYGEYIKVTQEVKQEEVPEVVTPTENINNENTNNNAENVKPAENILEELTINKEIDIYILPLINSIKISKTKINENVSVLSSTNKWVYISTNEVNGWITKASIADLINYVPEPEVVENTENMENTENKETTNEVNNNNNESNIENNTETTEEVNNNENNNITTPETQNTSDYKQKTMYVAYNSIYVRKGPGTNYDYVDTLVYNNSVLVIGEENDWYKVKVDNKEGYIAKWLLSETKKGSTNRGETTRSTEDNFVILENVSLGEQVVNYAKKYLDCKYVYGASGPDSFDAAGFTMFVYSKFEVSLSHSVLSQAKNGTYVSKEDLQLGDIVFFKDAETMTGVGHCGIYIGGGDFIHASPSAGTCVKISSLLEGSYAERYETARRLV